MTDTNVIDIELVSALTVFVRRISDGEPTLSDIERAGEVIRNALEIIKPDDARSERMARSLETTFELAADAAAAALKRLPSARRAAEQKAPSSKGATTRFYLMKEIEGDDCLEADYPNAELAIKGLYQACSEAPDDEVWSISSPAHGYVIIPQSAETFRIAFMLFFQFFAICPNAAPLLITLITQPQRRGGRKS